MSESLWWLMAVEREGSFGLRGDEEWEREGEGVPRSRAFISAFGINKIIIKVNTIKYPQCFTPKCAWAADGCGNFPKQNCFSSSRHLILFGREL